MNPRQGGGLVAVITKPDDLADGLLKPRPVEVGRSVVDRIAAQDNERLDLAFSDGGGQFGDGGRRFPGRFDKIDRISEVAESRIDRISDRVHGGREVGAGHNQGFALVFGEVGRAFIDPFRLDVEALGQGRKCLVAGHLGGERRSKGEHVAARQAEAVIGHTARQRHSAFGRVETIHRVVLAGHPAPLGEFSGKIKAARFRAQKIGVDGNNPLRLPKLIDRPDVPAECGVRGGERGLV
jgi:hypothetical protein